MRYVSTYRLVLALSLLAGCASTQEAGDGTTGGQPQVTFAQVKAAPDSYKGQSFTWGGQVLGARRLKEGTRIEILQLPLDRSGYPTHALTQSEGRFVAMHRDFLDPATIPPGTALTVTGTVSGSMTMPLDDTEYTYTVLEASQLRVWGRTEDVAPRIRPQIGPGPYWGPYWSPYWRPWPYW